MELKSRQLRLVSTALLILLPALPIVAQDFSDWSAPVNLGSVVNSGFNDEGPAISRDGLSLYFTSNRPVGGFGGQDIWIAQRKNKDSPWGMPVNLGPTVNTAADESAPAFTFDEHHMYFVRNRPVGSGLDIWVSFREDKHDDFGWQAPVNLGAPVNSPSNDAGPGSLNDGNEQILFFTSNRPGGPGGPDIFASVRQADGSFGTPVRVAELNSAAQDARAAVRHDGRELFFFSNRAAGSQGLTDLWTSSRKNRKEPWSTPVNLGSTVNSSADEVQPAISHDATTLFFASNRPTGSGLLDLYMITRQKDD